MKSRRYYVLNRPDGPQALFQVIQPADKPIPPGFTILGHIGRQGYRQPLPYYQACAAAWDNIVAQYNQGVKVNV